LAFALIGAFPFLIAAFPDGDLALSCFFATTFFKALAGFASDRGVDFLVAVFGVVFTAFLTRVTFAAFPATLELEIFPCFETEAVGRPEAGFFFSSFFSFEPNFEADLELLRAAATFVFALLFWRLESISLIPISFCLRGLTLWALRHVSLSGVFIAD
jgi:hypothetical protein